MSDEVEDKLDQIIAGLQFVNVTLMRLYDVQSALLASAGDRGEEYWNLLDNKHSNGQLHNGFPWLEEPDESE